MEPNLQRILDEITTGNRRMDEQFASFNRRFDELDRRLDEWAHVVDTRIVELGHRLCDLEAALADSQVAVAEGRVAVLEGSYADRNADFSNRLAELESLCVTHINDERDARVEDVEKATKELCDWRTGIDDTLNDILVGIRKLSRSSAREAFDEMPPGVVMMPVSAAAPSPAGYTANPPVVGPYIASTTRDLGSGVVTTWIPVPANGHSLLGGKIPMSTGNL